MEELMKKFEECLELWIDLPDYVYTDEYRNAFIEFVQKKIDAGQKINTMLATMALHHETEDRMPYFEFDRD